MIDKDVLERALVGKRIESVNIDLTPSSLNHAGSVSLILGGGEVVNFKVKGSITSPFIVVEINGKEISST